MIGLRIECPWCGRQVRADLIDAHLKADHRLGPIEADEIASRLRTGLAEQPLACAVVWAFTGMQMSIFDAKEFLADIASRAQVEDARRRWNRGPRWRNHREPPQPGPGHSLCFCCRLIVPQSEMVRKPDGTPGSICCKCRRHYFHFTTQDRVGRPSRTGGESCSHCATR